MSKRPILLYLTLLFSILYAALQVAAMLLHFYWIYWWFDWMMHFLAGVVGGLAVYWVLFYLWLWRRKSDKMLLPVLSVLICLMVIGIGWEIAEYKLNIRDSFEIHYADDVRNDLIADAFGAILAALMGVKATKLTRKSYA